MKKPRGRVCPLPIPAQQGSDREAVAQVVHAGQPAAGRQDEPEPGNQSVEGLADGARVEPPTLGEGEDQSFRGQGSRAALAKVDVGTSRAAMCGPNGT